MHSENRWEGAGGCENGERHQTLPPYGNRNEPYRYDWEPEAEGEDRPGVQEKKQKRMSPVKMAGIIAAAAVLFGTAAGGTMFAVYHAADTLFPVQEETEAGQENGGEALASSDQAGGTGSTADTSQGTVILEDVSPIVEDAMPSVVSITNTMLYQTNSWFGLSQTYEVPSSGSGIIIGQHDTELLIVTNNHVISDADSLSVTFTDESTVQAAVKGTDEETDLAILAVPLDSISADTKSHIKSATLGDSDSLKMGQGVVAIGNALGHGQSVTVGHVSALNRQIQVDGVIKWVIQTDAAINPGNSGGALLNSRGEVIGINEAKYADENVEGVGYAIPISRVKDIIDELTPRVTKIEVEQSEQGYLGIQTQNIDETISRLYGMPVGVYVYKIPEDSAAVNSDLREKDIITALDGEQVVTYADLAKLLTYYKSGAQVTLTVQSLIDGSYVERDVLVTLTDQKTAD